MSSETRHVPDLAPPTSVVLVEDDPVIREATALGLERLGYSVRTYSNGLDGRDGILAQLPDVLLLDVMLPGMNGASICQTVREHSMIPIIMLSARSEPVDMVQGLEAGADDYLGKPFDLEVLHARIRSVLRRCRESTPGPGHPQPPTGDPEPIDTSLLRIGSMELDTGRLKVSFDGTEVHLTPTEMRILLLLTEEPGMVFARERILQEIWGFDWAGEHRLVDVHVQRLRKKIGQGRVKTVRGFGYKFVG